MPTVPPTVKLWYCPDAVDMRLGFDGLFALVRNRLQADPLSGLEFPRKSGHRVNGYSGCSYAAGLT